LKDKLIARLPDYARHASRWPGLMNLRNRLPWARRAGERWLGLSEKRSLPAWRSDTFFRERANLGLLSSEALLARAREGGKVAVLFVDTFNGHFETENACAALRVLQAAGYGVHALDKAEGHHCCGRTFLASGMVEEAREKLGALVRTLAPLARQGIAVVGLEPSCLLTLRDEALVMGLGDDATVVSKQAVLFEEFLAREAQAGRFAPQLKPIQQPLLVHGHCHQKAFGAVQPVLDVLKLIPGAKPQLIESSCCGMAGSFGYEAEHHAVSMQMAELALLPAVRSAPEALVVADGTSCRHQIADGAGREALHVARVLERQLGG
jgi:Fe-S oxidoreductase